MSTDAGTPKWAIERLEDLRIQAKDTHSLGAQQAYINGLEFELSTLRTAHEAAQAEIAALREDAERYRWLQNQKCARAGFDGAHLEQCYLDLWPMDLALAIDAARRKP